tara:strand:- start:5940 stop:7124 length:1185 start_codon:yes stop_codon:yes gene_type:complete
MNIILILTIISFILILITSIYELYVFKNAPFLKRYKNKRPLNTSLSIVIPTYNEEINIKNCLTALSKIKPPSTELNIFILDDSSIDSTILVAEECKSNFFPFESNIEIIKAGERPNDKNWVGKNWPCFIGSKRIKSEWILFIDADVIVEEYCILNALSKSINDEIDLLSLAPKVNCNCFAEWIVQPIMTSLLMIGFPISNTNNPGSKTAFAAGPFMLFKRESYEKIGGHRGTYNEIVEDLALAVKIKDSNLKLNFLIAIDDISLNMYKDFNTLVEGWSKNWFLGLGKDVFKSLSALIFVFTIYIIPWSIFPLLLNHFLSNNYEIVDFYTLSFAFLGILTYGFKRYLLNYKFNIPNNFWFLNWLGAIVVMYISIISIYKTWTGHNWTWKGRKLSN